MLGAGRVDAVAGHRRAVPAANPRGRLRARAGRWAGRAVQQLVLGGLSVVLVAPLYFIAVTAFKTSRAYSGQLWALPLRPTLEAFRTAFERGDLPLWFRNSLVVATGSVLLTTVLALLASYATTTMRFPGRNLLRRSWIVLMMVPPIVLVIPLFVLFARLGLVNGFPSTILVFSGLLLPFSAFLFAAFFESLPHEILEAAALDGAGRFAILRQIVVPLALPAVVTQLLVNLLYVWNELLVVLIFLQGDDRKTLAAGITVFQGRFFRDTPLVMAASLLVATPMVVVYLVAQRAFIRGLTAGSLK